MYDRDGQRLNTRERLDRERYAARRAELVESIVEMCPAFCPPPDHRPAKKQRKIIIPVAEHPGYNFFGLIIGPRGNTQKRMQAETNTRIAVGGADRQGGPSPTPRADTTRRTTNPCTSSSPETPNATSTPPRRWSRNSSSS